MTRKGRYSTENFALDYERMDIELSTPREVAGGLMLARQRGAIDQTWWSKRLIEMPGRFGWTSHL